MNQLTEIAELLEYFILCQATDQQPSNAAIYGAFAVCQSAQSIQAEMRTQLYSYAVQHTTEQAPTLTMLFDAAYALSEHYGLDTSKGSDYRTLCAHLDWSPTPHSGLKSFAEHRQQEINAEREHQAFADTVELEASQIANHDDLHVRANGYRPKYETDLS